MTPFYDASVFDHGHPFICANEVLSSSFSSITGIMADKLPQK
jgi:hypothetical protein